MSAVLHTWGQNLSQHVPLHCLVPGGALDVDGIWREARSHYLFPVRALSRHFRGHLVSALRQAATSGELHRVTRPGDVDDQLNTLMATEWVVYSKDCLEHTDTVARYLARYTRRIAISNVRILAVDDHNSSSSMARHRMPVRPPVTRSRSIPAFTAGNRHCG